MRTVNSFSEPYTANKGWEFVSLSEVTDICDDMLDKAPRACDVDCAEYLDGWIEAVQDMKHASTMSCAAIDQHITHWIDFTPKSSDEKGYCDAMQEAVDKMNDLAHQRKY